MEFASSLLSSAASSLAAAQKPTLASAYSVDSSVPAVHIGVWKVVRAKHNGGSGRVVSIWTADKGTLVGSGSSRRGGASRDRERDAERLKYAVDVLKKEASSLSRLRHPCVLEMAEPMEESRSTIMFATEPVTASLRQAINASDAAHDSSRRGSYRSKEEQDLELDEVEVQKGLSQLGKGLQFLHESAKLVHGNLRPESVIINAKGDWKLSGFGLAQDLFSPNGVPAKWEFPAYDPALPPTCQRDYDYIAPEYICDEMPPAPSNDMYSLGCILHAIHTHTGPPFSNRNSLENLRTNVDEGLSRNLISSQWRKLPQDVQEVLASLLTRYPNRRMTAAQFLQSRYFEGLLVGTLRFLERDSFAAKTSEAQASFLKGLVSVLPQFSDKVVRRKILPSLLEETRKANLVPFLLPNILYIAGKMSPDDFRVEVLPSLKPIFTLKDPPQAVVALIEALPTFEQKCTPTVFREEVMPLVYFALESDNSVVLEKALRTIPKLCESLDYTTIKQTLFPKITAVFTKTTLLSVKVNTLICFHAMIPVLDKFTLTEKLVPLLAKIKTKEPSVMIATLAVHEEMGKKCEVEAIATLILPQLWAMSIGPLLNDDQFAKFMSVIKKLSTRVEDEHMKHLAELKRLEESSGATPLNGPANTGTGAIQAANVTDFESLVRGNVNGQKVNGLGGRGSQVDIFADDSPAMTPTPTGNAFNSPPLPALPTSSPPFASTSTFAPSAQPARPVASSRLSTSSVSASGRSPLGARTVPSASFNNSAFPSPPAVPASPALSTANPARTPSASLKSFAPLQPGPARTPSASSLSASTSSASYSQPNYNLSLSTTPSAGGLPALQPTTSSLYGSSSSAQPTPPVQWNRVPPLAPSPSPLTPSAAFSPPLQPTSKLSSPLPPGYHPSATMQPLQAQRPGGASQGNKPAMDFGAWADLDPLNAEVVIVVRGGATRCLHPLTSLSLERWPTARLLFQCSFNSRNHPPTRPDTAISSCRPSSSSFNNDGVRRRPRSPAQPLFAAAPLRPLSTPLGPSNAHNVPSYTAQAGPLSARKVVAAPNDLFAPSCPSSPLPPPSSAPRIRAKITPLAAPRRKALPGAEHADVPVSSGFSPLKRAPPPGVSPVPPPANGFGGFGAFPKVSNVAQDWELGALRGGMSGLGLGSISEVESRSVRKGGRDNVLVCVRVRPPAAKLAASNQVVDEIAWDVDRANGRLAQSTGGPDYFFDSVVTGSHNSDVYDEAGRDLVLDAMEGFDAVIFAYGQTASGKTFTLSGNNSNPGIIPQAVSEIFTYIRNHPEKEFLLRASYLEIYNESLKDLLDPTAGPKRFFVHPLREEVVTTEQQVADLLKRGADNRHVGQTDFNERSSRSHSVFQMTIESRDNSASSFPEPSTPRRMQTPNTPRLAPGSDGVVRMSRLSLIDLAGSEQATSQLERRSEGAFINKSLLTLEKVIASLTSDAKQKPHVPYRDSKLTQILQPSLSGDARVAVIATMNPSPAAIEETKSTLRFAQRVKRVVLKAVQHEVVDDKALITKYRSHIAMLEAQLKATLAGNTAPNTPSQADLAADQSRKKQAERVQDLERQVEEFRSLFLTSQNIEKRRQSALPPRPVSPIKVARSSTPPTDIAALEEKLLDAQDEIAALKDERDELKCRVAELEADRLSTLQKDASASDSDKDARILELTKENQELLVIVRNADVEGEMKRQERKYERQLEKHRLYQEGLESTLEQERKRVAQFERFILQHLSAQTEVLAGRRRSSGGITHSASVTGFVPLMAESPQLDAISPDFVELDDLPFSKAGKETISRSRSRMFS
uniref:BY PROTMAP: gi/342319027/gb/EGU10979.1/ Other/SCY1 protein kinase [Rhodotorula glutinis ATCC 204091] n=1 Tax=Rhodotorula toruloides TaxID=5286 RepID=A0A0K3CTW3_RHOTO